MNNVLNFINTLNIDKSVPIIVACSGGPDSMFLLKLLHNLEFNCVCAHVNHKVRQASEDEYKFLKKYCKDKNIIFEGTEILEYSKDNFHEFARTFRYNFFESLIKKYHAKYLFTAHHGDDLIETILMRLVRGSTLKGYGGFDLISNKDNYQIIRPLIYLTKAMIEEYNIEHNIPYAIDESNLEEHYTRNRYRHQVLPFLKSESQNVHEKFIKFSNLINDTNNYLEKEIKKYENEVYQNNIIDLNKFQKLDDFIQKKLLETIISYYYPDNLYLVSYNNLIEIIKCINSKKPNITISLPDNVNVVKKYNCLEFVKDLKKHTNYNFILDTEVKVPDGIIKIVSEEKNNSNYCIRLNSKNLKLPIRVRCRESGDKMCVKNLKGSKKISSIFIDMKVDFKKRSTWPIVVDSNNTILWVPGLKKSDFDIPIDGNYDIIIKYEKGEE